jgi:tetratricopeptide (TPR) repeat protein
MSETFDHLTARAQALIELGRPAQAIPLLTKAIAMEPNDVPARCHLSHALLQTGQFDEALNEAEAAIGVNTEHEWPLRLRAILLGQLGRYREALESALLAVQIEPESPGALYRLGSIYVNLKHFLDAEAVGARMLAVAPDMADTHELLALIAARQYRYRALESHVRQVLSIDPENSQAMVLLAMSLQGQGKHKAASEAASQAWLEAVRQDPSSARYRKDLIDMITGGRRANARFLAITMVMATVLGNMKDSYPYHLGRILLVLFAVVLVVMVAVHLIEQRRIIRSTPSLLQSHLKWHQGITGRVFRLSLLESALIGLLVASVFTGIICLVIGFLVLAVGQSSWQLFLLGSFAAGLIALVTRLVLRIVTRQQTELKRLVD